jgi:hypothetical protein
MKTDAFNFAPPDIIKLLSWITQANYKQNVCLVLPHVLNVSTLQVNVCNATKDIFYMLINALKSVHLEHTKKINSLFVSHVYLLAKHVQILTHAKHAFIVIYFIDNSQEINVFKDLIAQIIII